MTNHITIKNIVPRIRYISNGVLKTYSFPFALFKSSDLKVYFNTVLQEENTYTVSDIGKSTGGSITLSQAPANGVIITLIRELVIERTTDFQEGGTLRADTLNDELDYQIACQQQIADNLNRSMVLPPYATDTNINLTLPLPQAGKAIVWNAQGTNLENSTVSINALESTLSTYKSEAEAAAQTASEKQEAAATAAQTAVAKAQEAAVSSETAVLATTNKANKDMDNLTPSGIQKISTFCCPDYSAPSSCSFSNITTASENGYFEVSGKAYSGANLIISLNGIEKTIAVSTNSTYSTQGYALIPVCKNDTIKGINSYENSGTIVFYPLRTA